MARALKMAKNLSKNAFRSTTPRQLAWELLFEVETLELYSNLIVPRALTNSNFEQRDKALVTNLVYGTLRMKGFLDAAIKRHLDRGLDQVDLKTLTALRLGAYQLLILKTPPHAAVNEIVDLAKAVAGKSAASFVNAIMRRISENLEFHPSQWQEKYSHPNWIINAFRDALKEDAKVEAQLIADNEIALPTLAAWPGRSTHQELIAAGGELIPESMNAFSFKGNPGDIPAIRERRAGVQDLGSQLIVEIFHSTKETATAKLRWLDLCAGPGGKAAYLESLLSGDELVVNEPASARKELLTQVIRSSKIESFDGRDFPETLGNFDRILIDAPCTGLGALRRRPEVRWRRDPKSVRTLIQLQRELLNEAALHLNSKGIIGYATCSPHLAETKLQISDFLRTHKNFKRVSVGDRADKDGDLQLWTYKDGTDCMFLSLLQMIEE